MDTFFSNQRDIWGDIEKALGEYDEDNILEYCRPDEEIDYDHPTRSMAAVEDGPDWIFKPILDEFIEAFKDWVDSIDITKAEKACELPVEGKYLTFNYTETLEKYMGFPRLISYIFMVLDLPIKSMLSDMTISEIRMKHTMMKIKCFSCSKHGVRLSNG